MKARFLVTACAVATAGTATAEDWQWSLTPYAWATDVGLDIRLRDRELVDTTIAFDDLLQDLDSALLFRLQAMHGAHGLALDVFDVVVADDTRLALSDAPGSEIAIDGRVGTTIVDLTGIYELGVEVPGLSLLYGTRVINQREKFAARIFTDDVAGSATRQEVSDTLVDGLLGVRYAHALTGRWSYEVSADASTGGSDFTWSINPMVSYSFGDDHQYRVIAGYRYMAIDFDTQPAIDNDMTLSGVLVGLRFDF